MEGDLLPCVFLLLDFDSLRQARCVCKEWRWVLSDPQFRTRWTQRLYSTVWILLTAYPASDPQRRHGCMWNPDTKAVCPLPPWFHLPKCPPDFHNEIVDSFNGLVAVRQTSTLADRTDKMMVGNPVTDQWVNVPRSIFCHKFKYQLCVFRGGNFNLLNSSTSRLYESSTGKYRDVELSGAPQHEGGSVVSNVWQHRHRGLCYMEATTCNSGTHMNVVWVWESSSNSWAVVTEVEGDGSVPSLGRCAAGGRYVCMSDEFIQFVEQPMKPVVFDVEEGEWSCIRDYETDLEYGRALVHCFSLIRPAGWKPDRPELSDLSV